MFIQEGSGIAKNQDHPLQSRLLNSSTIQDLSLRQTFFRHLFSAFFSFKFLRTQLYSTHLLSSKEAFLWEGRLLFDVKCLTFPLTFSSAAIIFFFFFFFRLLGPENIVGLMLCQNEEKKIIQFT